MLWIQGESGYGGGRGCGCGDERGGRDAAGGGFGVGELWGLRKREREAQGDHGGSLGIFMKNRGRIGVYIVMEGGTWCARDVGVVLLGLKFGFYFGDLLGCV